MPIVRNVIRWSKQYALPGFQGIPIYTVIVFIYKEMMRDNITTRANSVAFSVFLALFPFIIFLFSILPLLPFTADYVELASNYIEQILPNQASTYLIDIIEGLTEQREGLIWLTIFLSILFASSGMYTLMAGFDKSYDHAYKERSYLKKRFVALNLTLVLALWFILSFVLLVFGNFIVAYLEEAYQLESHHVWVITITKWLFTMVLLYFAITIIYRYGPSFRERTPFINPGALLATILSLMTSLAFSYFINNFGRYNEIYGSIGALIVLMLWIQFNAFVILIGYEIIASIAVHRDLLDIDKVDD